MQLAPTYFVIPLECPSELADQSVIANHRIDDRNKGRKNGSEGQAGRLYLHNAARNKPTDFDEIFGEGLGHDVFNECLMLPTLTLLTILVIASQASRWYSALLRSCAAVAWRARSLAGGMYTPPEREDVSLTNSAMVSNSFSFVPPFFSFAFSSSTAAIRSASWREEKEE